MNRSWLWVALAGLSLHLGGMAACSALAPQPEPSVLMPANGGAITDVAIQFHDEGAELFLPVFGELLQSLSPETTVHVVVADSHDRRVFAVAAADWFPNGGGPTLVYSETGRPITSWMRDRLAVLSDGDQTTLLAPAAPMRGPEARVYDWLVPWSLAHDHGMDAAVARPTFLFDGGDLIADETFAYVADPLFGRNPDASRGELIVDLEHELGLPVLALRDTPDHHIGMFVTPLGHGRVLVADPDLGLSLLSTTPEPGGIGMPVMSDPEQLQRFRNVADQLEEAGLEVISMPIVPSTEPWVWMSYNNAMLETRDGQLHVYMPTYGVPALDDAATEVWVGQGAVVHPIDVSDLFRLGGSVRCLTAPILRN